MLQLIGSEWLLLFLFGSPLYFLPSIIAGVRKNPNTLAIFIINSFFGWTILGWIGTMIYAFSTEYIGEDPELESQIQPDLTNAKLHNLQAKIDQLRQLKQLLDEGILTNEEFNSQKAAILGQ